MTDLLKPGDRIGPFEVLTVEAPLGRRVSVACRCGRIHVFSTESVLSGDAACLIQPMTRERRARLRESRQAAERIADVQGVIRDWKPKAE